MNLTPFFSPQGQLLGHIDRGRWPTYGDGSMEVRDLVDLVDPATTGPEAPRGPTTCGAFRLRQRTLHVHLEHSLFHAAGHGVLHLLVAEDPPDWLYDAPGVLRFTGFGRDVP